MLLWELMHTGLQYPESSLTYQASNCFTDDTKPTTKPYPERDPANDRPRTPSRPINFPTEVEKKTHAGERLGIPDRRVLQGGREGYSWGVANVPSETRCAYPLHQVMSSNRLKDSVSDIIWNHRTDDILE